MISLLGQKYNSKETTSNRGNIIHAHYKDPNDSEQEPRLRPAEIQYFFRHDVSLRNVDGFFNIFTFTFAYVRWFNYSDIRLTTFETINTTTYSNSFEPDSASCILPVHSIHSPAGIYYNILDNKNLIIKFHRKITE